MITISRSTFYKRYIPSTARVVKTSLRKWDQFCFVMSLEQRGIVPFEPGTQKYVENFANFNPILFESEFFLMMRKDENKAKKYVVLDALVQSLLVDGKTGRNLDVNTARVFFNFICAWWRLNEIDLDPYKLKAIKWPKKILERVQGISRKNISDIIALCDDLHKGIFYVCVYSAMRIDEVLSMSWSWIDFDKQPLKISIPGKYTKTKQDRITFVGNEAATWLKSHKKNDGLVFSSPRTGNKMYYSAVWQYFSNRRMKLNLVQQKENGRHHIKIHSFRGYAENKLGRGTGGSEFAHSILGHRENLISYNQSGKTDEDAAADYESALPFLALSEQTLKDQNTDLKNQLQMVQADLRRLSKGWLAT